MAPAVLLPGIGAAVHPAAEAVGEDSAAAEILAEAVQAETGNSIWILDCGFGFDPSFRLWTCDIGLL